MSIEYKDIDKTGTISFSDLQKIMEEITDLQMKDSYIDYLIYFMKCSDNSNLKLEDLEYNVNKNFLIIFLNF